MRFTKAGLFRYVCDIHPGMKGAVRVVAKSGVAISGRRPRRVSCRPRAIAVAKAFKNVKAPPNTVDLGLGGPGGVSLFAFSPEQAQRRRRGQP